MAHQLSFRRSLTILLVSFLVVSGCAYPSKLETRERGVVGMEINKADLDFSFVQVGRTRREDILTKLSAIDSGYSHPKLFWGRWASSSWGMVRGIGILSEYEENQRIWNNRNLLISFEENGTVTNITEVEEKVLCRKLQTHVSQLPVLDLSEPQTLKVGYFTRDGRSLPAQITLANEW